MAQFLADKRTFHTAQEATAGHPPAIACVTNRIHYYKSRGIKVAVASSGLRDIVER
jgi:beta-phosphoglucomutase-like phosphatase (HAD superfamily)